MRVIAIMNQQQGVGKTTIALNLGHGLARKGYKVALVEMDPKMTLTKHLNLSGQNEGLDAVMLQKKSLDEVSVLVRDNLTFVTAGRMLAGVERESGRGIKRGYVLLNAVQDSSFSRYDFVLLDCASLSGILAMNAMLAASEVLMPILPSAASIEKLADLIAIFKQFIQTSVAVPRVWLVLNKTNSNNPAIQQIREKIRGVFPDRVLTTMLQHYPRLQQPTFVGKTLFDDAGGNKGAADFQALVDDLLRGRTS